MALLLSSSVQLAAEPLLPPRHGGSEARPSSCDKRDQQHKEKPQAQSAAVVVPRSGRDTAPEKAAPPEEDGDEEEGSKHDDLHLVVDSGARAHATGSLAHLRELKPAPRGGAEIYCRRDGRDLPVDVAGTIAHGEFHLSDVLYVPELGARSTFVSVAQLAASGHLVMFGGGCCYVKNRSDGSLVGKGRMHDGDGLYHLEFLRITPGEVHADI